MTMTRKLNNDNGLQDWKTEHQAVTRYIKNWADSAKLQVLSSHLPLCGLTVYRSEMPNFSYTHPLPTRLKKQSNKHDSTDNSSINSSFFDKPNYDFVLFCENCWYSDWSDRGFFCIIQYSCPYLKDSLWISSTFTCKDH